MKRPEDFEFSLELIGDPEATNLLKYIQQLEEQIVENSFALGEQAAKIEKPLTLPPVPTANIDSRIKSLLQAEGYGRVRWNRVAHKFLAMLNEERLK